MQHCYDRIPKKTKLLVEAIITYSCYYGDIWYQFGLEKGVRDSIIMNDNYDGTLKNVIKIRNV